MKNLFHTSTKCLYMLICDTTVQVSTGQYWTYNRPIPQCIYEDTVTMIISKMEHPSFEQKIGAPCIENGWGPAIMQMFLWTYLFGLPKELWNVLAVRRSLVRNTCSTFLSTIRFSGFEKYFFGLILVSVIDIPFLYIYSFVSFLPTTIFSAKKPHRQKTSQRNLSMSDDICNAFSDLCLQPKPGLAWKREDDGESILSTWTTLRRKFMGLIYAIRFVGKSLFVAMITLKICLIVYSNIIITFRCSMSQVLQI